MHCTTVDLISSMFSRTVIIYSGAGTNLKVRVTCPERKWEGTDPAQSIGKKNFGGVIPLHFFWL